MARKAAGLALENSRALLKTCYGRLPSSSSSLPRPEERLLGVGGGRLALQNVDVCAPASSYPAPQASREGHFSGICERKGHLRSRSTQYQQLFRIAPSASCSIKSGQWSTSQWSETSRGYHRRSLSLAPYTNGKRKFLIDTLALVRKLEAQGLSAQQAEGITDLIAQIMNETMDDLAQNFVSKQEMQMTVMKAETEFSRFKNDMKSLQEQNHDSLRREMERLKTEIEKIRSELKYEMDKVTAGQRLDLNLEKGRMREELQNQGQETSNLSNKFDRDINTLKTEMEAAKFDVIKYCVGTLVSVSAVGLGLLRILM